MRNIWTIAKRELRSYFYSPIAYIIALFIFLIIGVIFYINILAATQNQLGGGRSFAPNLDVVLDPMAFLFLFAVPAITMRSLAGEQRNGTMELLLTSPVKDWELVVGKWLGAYLYTLLIILGAAIIYPVILNNVTQPGIDQGFMVTGFLGLALFVGAFVALGVMVSSFFNNQVAALFMAVGLNIFLAWLLTDPSQGTSATGEVLTYLNLGSHYYESFMRGIIQLKDIVYYVSVIALALFIGTISIETRRWR